MSFAERFDQALKNAGKKIRPFHEELANSEKWSDVPGSSYSMIHRYLRGKSTPPVEFIEAAADMLGVNAPWLAFGTGPRDQNETLAQEKEIMERAWKLGSLTEHDEERAFAYLSEEDRIKHHDKRAAIGRFSAKMSAAISAPFADMETRTHVLQCALRFLIGVEEMFDQFGDPDPDNPDTRLAFKGDRSDLYLLRSDSSGWRATWQDAVLDLYARRVKGLGERSDEYFDQHAASGRVPLSDPEDYRL